MALKSVLFVTEMFCFLSAENRDPWQQLQVLCTVHRRGKLENKMFYNLGGTQVPQVQRRVKRGTAKSNRMLEEHEKRGKIKGKNCVKMAKYIQKE